MTVVRAVFQDGKFQPLDEVKLENGQEVHLHIVQQGSGIRDLIADMLVQFDYNDTEFEEDAIMTDLENVLAGKRPLSEIIIEEREDRA